MSNNIYGSDLEAIKMRVLNFARSNNGYTEDNASRSLGIPINVIRVAVAELKREGLLQQSTVLKVGRRVG